MSSDPAAVPRVRLRAGFIRPGEPRNFPSVRHSLVDLSKRPRRAAGGSSQGTPASASEAATKSESNLLLAPEWAA